MKIYELLGVKVFRKMAFSLRDILNILKFPSTIKMSKKERKEFLYNTVYNMVNNYNLGKVESLEDIKDFKKILFINAGIHICTSSLCFPYFLRIIGGTADLPIAIIDLTGIVINLYCIMLQRYNVIRINQLIKRMTPRYEKQKNTIKEELKKEDSLLLEHSYKIVDKKEKETNITFEDLIVNANIEQLKQYRDYLAYFQSVNQAIQENEFYSDNQQMDISMPIEKTKHTRI